MENTASSSMETRLKILQQIITWKFKPDLICHEVKVAWTEAHLSALLDYVLKLEGITRSKFSAYNSEILERFEPQNSEKLPEMIVCFMKDLGILFEVPKLIQFSSDNENNLNKNEILAAFMDFLLQLLYHRIASIIPFEDCIDCLEKELHFLVTVLGDTPLINVGAHLLTEFEAVANDAGSLVYSLVFLSDHLIIDNELDALLKRIHHLKLSISKFLYLLPFITNVDINTPNTSVSVDSLFILDSLLYDLDDLVNQEGCPIVDVKDQIKILRQELMLSQSLLKGIRVPPHSDIQELNQTVMRIREAAYEAEYLVNSFLAHYAPAWYLTTRLTHVINKIKHTETLLQEIKQNYDIGDLKVSEDVSSPQIPLQAKRISEAEDIIVGFEDTTSDILDQLVGGTEHLQVIFIFGMPGLGKTTFARKLYNHPSVDYRFDKRSWCVVSQTYQRKRVLADIVICLTNELNKDRILEMKEENLVEHIYKSLKGRRYLIVMDDIWDLNAWDDVRRCFPDDRNGSRILFTVGIKMWLHLIA